MSAEKNIEEDLKTTLNKQDTQKISNDTEDMNDTSSTETQDMTTSSLPSTSISDTSSTSITTSTYDKQNLNNIPVKMGGTIKRKVKKTKSRKNKRRNTKKR